MTDGLQISISLAAITIILREGAWFIKTLRGNDPMREAMKELTTTLKEMNRKLDDNHHISERIHDKVSDMFARRS